MRKIFTIYTVLTLTLLAGCSTGISNKQLLTVNFQPDKTLRYKFKTNRDIELDWNSNQSNSAANNKGKITKSSESTEIIVDYTPIEIEPYGLTKIKATCKSVKVIRKPAKRKNTRRIDAVEHLKGKSFIFSVRANGKIEDRSSLKKLLVKAGNKAIRKSGNRKIKDPDIIDDFIATQWFLWDSISSIENPSEGIKVGQSWNSILSVPNPMVIRKARNVEYKLDEIQNTEKGDIAVIQSTYSPAKSTPSSWPIPYTGRFMVSGTYGTLRNYNIVELNGQGQELFNLDKGITEKYIQEYEAKVKASFRFPLSGVNPMLKIKQTITMQLIED